MLLCIYPIDCWFLAFLLMNSISLWTFLCSLYFILWTLLSFIVINCAIWSTDHKVVINLSWIKCWAGWEKLHSRPTLSWSLAYRMCSYIANVLKHIICENTDETRLLKLLMISPYQKLSAFRSSSSSFLTKQIETSLIRIFCKSSNKSTQITSVLSLWSPFRTGSSASAFYCC